MNEPKEEQMRLRAYKLWERHGRPEGRQDEFWLRAEQELRDPPSLNPFALLNQLT
jgi:hypothetical protein